MNKQSFQVILPDDLDRSLRSYFYEVAREAVEKVRIETALNKEFLNLGETCEYLNCSRNTLDKYIKKYHLRISIIEGKTYISKTEIVNFLKKFEK